MTRIDSDCTHQGGVQGSGQRVAGTRVPVFEVATLPSSAVRASGLLWEALARNTAVSMTPKVSGTSNDNRSELLAQA